MLLLLATAISSAVAAPSDVPDLVRELLPEIEQRAGRSFAHAPIGSVVPRARLEVAMARPLPRIRRVEVGPVSLPDHELAARRARARSVLDHTMAVYLPGREGLYVVEESLDGAVQDFRLSPRIRRALVQCFVAHELVHALQHQHGTVVPPDGAPEQTVRGHAALLEGHATFVASAYCRDAHGEAVLQLKDAIGGQPSAASHDPDGLPALYAWGHALAAALHAEDPELLWAAVLGDAPPWSAIVAATAPVRPDGWRAPAALGDAAHRLDPGATELEESQLTDPWHTLAVPLARVPGVHTLPRSLAGWRVRLAGTDGQITALALLLDGEPPARLPQLRQRALGAEPDRHAVLGGRRPALMRPPAARRWRALEAHDAVTYAIRVHAPTRRHRYRELWAATDDVAVVLAYTGARVPRAREAAAVTELLAALPTSRPGPVDWGPLEAWLAGVRELRRELPPTTSWSYRLHRAAAALERDSTVPACATAFHDVLAPDAVPDPRPYAAAAFACAARRHEIGLAAQALALLPTVDGALAVYHARHLRSRGRPRSARAVLTKVAPSDPHHAEARALRASLGPTGARDTLPGPPGDGR